MEADQEPGDCGSRNKARSRLKEEIKSSAVETEKGYQKKGRSGYRTRQQGATGRIKGESGRRLSSLNKHAIN